MKHVKFKRLLSLYLDGELNENQRYTVESHLAHCADCRAFYETHNRVREWMPPEESIQVNPYFATRVWHTYQARKRESFWSLFERIPKPVVATGLVLSLLILSFFSIAEIDSSEPVTSNTTYAILFEDSNESDIQTDEDALEFVIYNKVMTVNGD